MTPPELPIAQDHHKAGRLPEAERLYRQILTQHPHDAGTLYLLGQLLHQTGRSAESIQSLQRAIEIHPNFPEAHHQLGMVLRASGDLTGAMASFRQALALRPRYALALNSVGLVHQSAGRELEAIESFRAALDIQPDLVVALTNLGALLTGRDDAEAIRVLTLAVQLQPDLPGPHNNLGNALERAGRLDEAIAEFQRTIQLRPDYAQAYTNFGNVMKDAAQWPAALDYYRRAVELEPTRADWHSNLIAALNYAPLESPEILRRELELWNQRHAKPLESKIRPHDNDPAPDRRLKIGYVSPDLHTHAVGRVMLPLVSHHDHQHFEITCYSDTQWPDETTLGLESHADVWRDSRGLSDSQLADWIRRDRIDILVDLSLHTAKNRLLTFAEKPAPVQVSYLGYVGTTGMTAVDFRLTDPYLDPPGAGDSCYSETSIRLAHTYWCYQPTVDIPVNPEPPATKTGMFTFGCQNNYCKVSPAVWSAWAEILRAQPNSRLLVYTPHGSHREIPRKILAQRGIDPARLLFSEATGLDYFQTYHQIDIALDPFPYCGGMTTCDALWMGVPVITLRGQTGVGRGGTSLLSNVGLTELIAENLQRYIQIAAELAADLPRLTRLRQNIRPQMQQSPLMNAPAFARDIEAAYRQMWNNFCRR
jgi:predicted O-linked N-acetylglucosamine transferase (SPINDLY family)